MPKVIIGLVGTPGCGKGTVAKLLQEKYGAELYRFSAVLSDLLNRLGLEKTRDNMIAMSETLRNKFGEDVLAYAIEQDVSHATADLVVIDGVRRISDLAALEPLSHFTLVEVVASPEIRYARMKARGEKSGEATMTWEKFLAEEQASTELTIASVAARATKKITNNGTTEDLEQQIDTLMAKLAKTAQN